MIANLQALRAVAAWMVVLHHMRDPLGAVWPPLGETLVFAAGVDLFFVLSGFVMVASTDGRAIRPAAFWRRRLFRVAPLYWLMTLGILAMLAAGLAPVGIGGWTAGDAAAAFAFVADQRADGYPGPLLGVGWTLTYEAAFYGLFGLALFARNVARPGLIVIAAIAGLVALGALTDPAGFAARTYLAPILLEFAAGVALGLYLRTAPTTAAATLLALGVIGLLAGGGALTALAPNGDLITPGGAGAAWRTVCFGLPAASIVAGAVLLERAGRVCRNETALSHGAASYAIYLSHLIVLQIVFKIVGAGALALPIGLIAAGVVGVTLHRVVEAPLTKWLNGSKIAGLGHAKRVIAAVDKQDVAGRARAEV